MLTQPKKRNAKRNQSKPNKNKNTPDKRQPTGGELVEKASRAINMSRLRVVDDDYVGVVMLMYGVVAVLQIYTMSACWIRHDKVQLSLYSRCHTHYGGTWYGPIDRDLSDWAWVSQMVLIPCSLITTIFTIALIFRTLGWDNKIVNLLDIIGALFHFLGWYLFLTEVINEYEIEVRLLPATPIFMVSVYYCLRIPSFLRGIPNSYNVLYTPFTAFRIP